MKISPKSFLSTKSTHHVNDVDLGHFFWTYSCKPPTFDIDKLSFKSLKFFSVIGDIIFWSSLHSLQDPSIVDVL
jgi:hypothetical protein